MPRKRRVCFVTGTRAEFGLMRPALDAIASHRQLELQIIATGMHLDRRRGYSLGDITAAGFEVNATIPWRAGQERPIEVAQRTGEAIAKLAQVLSRLESDVVLVVGDRVEAFAAAAAGHIGGAVVAHVHGGDRALGQVDDSLRHAITKLAHVHFPATRESARRIRRLGEDAWRIHRVGSPGIDGIRQTAASHVQLCEHGLNLPRRKFALLLLHPADSDNAQERRRAALVLAGVKRSGINQVVIIYPNNDPGAAGIVAAWQQAQRSDPRLITRPNVTREVFLGLLRDAAVMVGNSSSGIIESASFATPVVNVGARQLGRERSENVTDVPYSETAVRRAVARTQNDPNLRRSAGRNVYGRGDTGRRIADVLGRLVLDQKLRRKLIAY
jgi:GDP/UDP-N,N'-diacetylbacillosamine 2-epimerase (hydrolysing)